MQNDAGGYIDGANTYQFVLSNPLVYTDPSGLCADSGWKWWLQKATAVLQVVAGAAEIWLGSGAAPMLGFVLTVHGWDTATTGLENLFGNGSARTETSQRIADAARWMGAGDTAAKWIGDIGDASIGIGASVKALSNMAKAGRAAEAAAEALSAGERQAARAAANALNAGERQAAQTSAKAARIAPNRFSEAKQALVDMAKADKRVGITEADMSAYKQLNRELPDPFPADQIHGPELHPNRPSLSSQRPHGHVGPVDHIPISEE